MSVILLSIVVISLLAAALAADGIRVELKRSKAKLDDLGHAPTISHFDQGYADEGHDDQPKRYINHSALR